MPASTVENPGCLTSFLSIFRGNKKNEPINTPQEDLIEVPVESLPYRVRDDFLSPAEFSFYKILVSLVGTNRTIQSKVRLADIFFVARPNENAKYFNKISAKHLDFLVCDSTTMKPLFGVELDDASHQRAERIERDEFVDKVFDAANLPLYHMPTKREYSSGEIIAVITPLFKQAENTPVSTEIETPVLDKLLNNSVKSDGIPQCPKCGIPLVVRTVSQGDHKGKQFYGCQNFPRCREMKPFSA